MIVNKDNSNSENKMIADSYKDITYWIFDNQRCIDYGLNLQGDILFTN